MNSNFHYNLQHKVALQRKALVEALAVNLKKAALGSSSQSSDTSITTVKCKSINSGITLINNHISKKINLSHCQEILISEKLAKQGLSEHLDTLLNNIELRRLLHDREINILK